jgi:protein O-mannosyl-transferase
MMLRRTRILMWASVICLAVAASISGITNRFAFDDFSIIVRNSRTHSLAHWWQLFAQSYWPQIYGGDLYRPVTMVGFAIQWALGGGAPLVFHAVSIGLYALVCAAFLAVLLELLPAGTAWFGAALFAVHPLHVEAVANVVGQSELLAALFMFLALLVFLRSRSKGAIGARDISVITLLYVIACLSKEHAIVLPALLFAAEATVFATSTKPLRARLGALRLLGLTMAAAGLAFLYARFHVLGPRVAASDEANALLLGQPFGIRMMTMLRVLLEWVRLFLWPARLSADYSPQAIALVTGPSPEMLASAAILVGCTGLAWAVRKRVPVAAFAFLWVVIALLIPSNLIIPTGFTLAERTLFLASAGVMLAIAAVAAYLTARNAPVSRPARLMLSGLVGILLVLGLVRSALRQRIWHDSDTLVVQTVKDVPASYRAHMSYALFLFQHDRRSDAFQELSLANALFPADPSAMEFAAEAYSSVEGCGRAVGLFRRVLTERPARDRSRVGLAECLIAMGRHAEARRTIMQGFAFGNSKSSFEQLRAANDSAEASHRLPKRE